MTMDANDFVRLLLGNDLRTIKQNKVVIQSVKEQKNFDELFTLTFLDRFDSLIGLANDCRRFTL